MQVLTTAPYLQALAWVAFLPSERRVTSVVEVSLQVRAGQPALNACYEGWSAALGVRYFRVAGRLTGGCTGGATSRAGNQLASAGVGVGAAHAVAAPVAASVDGLGSAMVQGLTAAAAMRPSPSAARPGEAGLIIWRRAEL